MHIWDRKSAIELHQFKAQEQDRQESDSDLTCIAWNPAASPFMFAAGSHDGTVTVWTSAPAPPALTSSSYVDLRHSGTSTPARTITPPPQTLAPDAPRTDSPANAFDDREGHTSNYFSSFLKPPPREKSEERRTGITFQSLAGASQT